MFVVMFLSLLLFVNTVSANEVPNKNTASSLNSVAVDKKTIEKLIKATETTATTIRKKISISEPNQILAINAKSIQGLTSAIEKAKINLKNYKGKDKASFEKRLKQPEQTLGQAKVFNTTITNGERILKEKVAFQKLFTTQPFNTEKQLNELIKKNQQYTKDINKLTFTPSRNAFYMKYQESLEMMISDKTTFYSLNKRIEAFISFTKNHEPTEVWEEFDNIYTNIYSSLLDEDDDNLIQDKWKSTYYPTFVAPEEANIQKFVKDYYDAINARDAEALAELYPYKSVEEKNIYIEEIKESLSKLPSTQIFEVLSYDELFVYENEASAYFTLNRIVDGIPYENFVKLYLYKFDGKWLWDLEKM
jgi:hypothetical protein